MRAEKKIHNNKHIHPKKRTKKNTPPRMSQRKAQQRSASAAAFVQRVWHGPHGSRSKMPPVVSKDVPTVAPELRRKRAIDAFFDQQQRTTQAKLQRELKSGGAGSRWDENPMQRFRLKHGIYSPEDESSCYYIRQSKEVHAVQLPSYKTDCPRACSHNGLTASPNEAGGAPHQTNAADGTSFFVEPLTRLMRERWQAREEMRAAFIARHESRYPLRRIKDRSAQTLDNQYRQEMDPTRPGQTVMRSVLGGTFYDNPPQTKHRVPTKLTPDFVSTNKKNVRSASAVVGICRDHGTL